MYKYSSSLPRRVLAHAYHFLQEKKMFTSLTISSPSKNVFYQRSPPPGGWENTFFERRRKYELSEHFLLLNDMSNLVVFCCSENTWNIGPYCIISQLSRKVFTINMQKYISPDSEELGEFNGCHEKPIWAYGHDL